MRLVKLNGAEVKVEEIEEIGPKKQEVKTRNIVDWEHSVIK